MILKLKRNKETMVDIEIYVKSDCGIKFIELRSVVMIESYSKFLLDNLDQSEEIIKVFTDISELRGWLWESYFMGEENDPNKLNDVIVNVKGLLVDVAFKYKLFFTID